MKIPLLNSIDAALEHADDAEVQDALSELLEKLDADLANQGYEADITVENATAALDKAVGAAANRKDNPDDGTD